LRLKKNPETKRIERTINIRDAPTNQTNGRGKKYRCLDFEKTNPLLVRNLKERERERNVRGKKKRERHNQSLKRLEEIKCIYLRIREKRGGHTRSTTAGSRK